MEEFTQKRTSSDDVILAEGAKMTVRPIHEETQVIGEQSGAEIANAHATGPAIGNFEGDVEVTGSNTAAQQAKSAEQRAAELLELHKAATPTTKSAKLPVSIIVIAVMIGMLLFFLLYR